MFKSRAFLQTSDHFKYCTECMFLYSQLLNSLGLLFEIYQLVNISFLNTVEISVPSVKLR